MITSSSGRRPAFHAAIEQFLKDRLEAKLDKLSPDDPKREVLASQHQPAAWIDDAARRVAQIQAVTHSLKPIHPDARGTNLYRPPGALRAHAEIGTHALGAVFADDVVGNAAALDVYKFLKIDVEGKTLLEWMLVGDPALAEALSLDPAQSEAWMEAFTGLTRPRSDNAASHARAKQLYWLTGDDPSDDNHYHLLAPLYASSLAHAVFRTINEDRFSEAVKDARKARRENREHEIGFHEYPNLATQKLGGTKPQNISQLNSERGGNNYLLGSLPPRWRSRTRVNPWLVESLFPRFGHRNDVRAAVQTLRDFLLADPEKNVETRNRVERYFDTLVDELIIFASELQAGLPVGWSADERCRLVDEERLWLDPGRVETDDEFRERWLWMEWPDQIGKRFGNWLNSQLDKKLSVGEAEARQWRRELLLDEAWADRLHKQRKRLDAPTYIPTRGAAS